MNVKKISAIGPMCVFLTSCASYPQLQQLRADQADIVIDTSRSGGGMFLCVEAGNKMAQELAGAVSVLCKGHKSHDGYQNTYYLTCTPKGGCKDNGSVTLSKDDRPIFRRSGLTLSQEPAP